MSKKLLLIARLRPLIWLVAADSLANCALSSVLLTPLRVAASAPAAAEAAGRSLLAAPGAGAIDGVLAFGQREAFVMGAGAFDGVGVLGFTAAVSFCGLVDFAAATNRLLLTERAPFLPLPLNLLCVLAMFPQGWSAG